MAPELSLYNTALRGQAVFTPLHPGIVNLYCCGPTVYHYAHIGNLRTYIFEDLLRRTLDYAGYKVNHIVNITDVGHLTSDADTGEDKMEKGAAREGKSVWDIANFYTEAFIKDWNLLGLVPPTKWTKATDHIAEQIDLVKILEAKDLAYVIPEDGVYFDTAKFPRYADFAGLDIKGMQAGARVERVEGKRNSTDFALWKISPKDTQRAMEWDSPWGRGFPGWHVECSAMAMKHCGPTLDIHCGGTDHIRVHHTNEIAQSEGATGVPFSRFWMHGGWLLEAPAESESGEKGGGGKMSKSSGEFITLEFLISKGYGAMDYRYFCLTASYRSYLNFSWEGLDSSRDSLRNLRRKTDPLIGKASAIASDNALNWQGKFRAAIYDDLGFPQGMAVLNQMLKDPDLLEGEKAALIVDFEKLLGLGLTEKLQEAAAQEFPADLLPLLDERLAARKKKDFKRSDEIRDLLKARGYGIKDNPDGTASWFSL